MTTPDESLRFGVLSVPAYAIRWFICLFSMGTTYLTVANTLTVVIQTKASGWLETQRIATEELVRAGGASLVGSVIIVEVANLVLGEWIRQRRRQRDLEEGRDIGLKQGLEQGLGQGRSEVQSQWESWNRRREEAEKRGEKFDEPPPGLTSTNGGSFSQ